MANLAIAHNHERCYTFASGIEKLCQVLISDRRQALLKELIILTFFQLKPYLTIQIQEFGLAWNYSKLLCNFLYLPMPKLPR